MAYSIGMRLRRKSNNEFGRVAGEPVMRDGIRYYPVAIDKDPYSESILGAEGVDEWPENDVEPSNYP